MEIILRDNFGSKKFDSYIHAGWQKVHGKMGIMKKVYKNLKTILHQHPIFNITFSQTP